MSEEIANYASQFAAESEWLRTVLECLLAYSTRISARKRDVEDNIEQSLKMYDPDNVDQFAEVLINKSLLDSLSLRNKMSSKSLQKPYFARVDFREQGKPRSSGVYLGKMSIMQDDGDAPLVVDWRAPVASLYYDGRIGEAAYECPDGFISGEISLKRQYFIENGKLDSFLDIDITANDAFLQTALGASKDKRLRDIVSTIQAEQNRIIRADMHGPVVVQGAAGGGKTTIALHRVAYLLYNHERLSPAQVMIIAPNRYFLSYISEVLPDLGVENVSQTTYEDFAFGFIEKTLKLYRAEDKLAFILDDPGHSESVIAAARLKSSLAYKTALTRYITHITSKILPVRDFTLDEYLLMDRREINRLFAQEYTGQPLAWRLNEVRKYLSNALKKRKPELLAEIAAYYDAEAAQVIKSTPEASPERRASVSAIYEERDRKLARIKSKSSGLVSAYFKNVKLRSAWDYYKDFIQNEKLFLRCLQGLAPSAVAKAAHSLSSRLMQNNMAETEDLAPLIHLHRALYGSSGFDARHVVIDEAQDISPYQTAVLQELMGTGSFTILGDLCQGVYAFKGISSWDELRPIFAGDFRFMTLEQSYRTTVEIMDFANIAACKLSVKDAPLACPVIRHGTPVRLRLTHSQKETAAAISQVLSQYTENGHKSIAVICKTADACRAFYTLLKSTGITLLTGRESDYTGGTVILPAYLAKGLEFDGVVIADASASVYSSDDLDIKLLYVAMTRALHELTVFAQDELTCALNTVSE